MRRITLWLLTTVAALVLLFSYRTSLGGTGIHPITGSGGGGAGAGSASSGGNSSGGSSSSGGGSSGAGTSAGKATYEGSVAQTQWGPVQVTITTAHGKITGVSVPVYPTGNSYDQQINAYALPILKQETLAAQSANIDTVSGATITSGGYVESLQAALDAAHM